MSFSARLHAEAVSLRRFVGVAYIPLIRHLICYALLVGATAGFSGPAQAAWTPGSLPGKFDVSPTGAATYTIPFTFPVSKGQLAPKLALVYNSQHASGLAGYGWTLSGLSEITRCGHTLAQDGDIQPVTFTNSDDYCLDGQKLVPLPTGNGFYRTEIDHISNIRAYYNGGAGTQPDLGPQWFKVQQKDGLTYIYGATSDSEILARGPSFGSAPCSTPSPLVVRAWALTRIVDRNGHAISFHYARDMDPCAGGYWPDHITYSDTVDLNTSTYPVTATGPFNISFSYSAITGWPVPPDFRVIYRGGATIGNTQLLEGMTVSYNGTTKFVYDLEYQADASTLYDQLTHVVECAGSSCTLSNTASSGCSATCFHSTEIGWHSGGQRGWEAMNSISDSQDPFYNGYGLMLDAFGDGSEDYAYLKSFEIGGAATFGVIAKAATNQNIAVWTATNVPMLYNNMRFLPINYRGDGRQSILLSGQDDMCHVITFVRTVGSADLDWTDINTHISCDTVFGNAFGGIIIADVNGDGRDDIVYGASDLGPSQNHAGYRVYLNSVTGFGSSPVALPFYDAGANADWQWFGSNWTGRNPSDGVRTVEFDGDGRADFLVNEDGTLVALRSTGSQGNPQLVQLDTIPTANPDVQPLILDANGDGLSDVAYVNRNNQDWMLAISTGDGFKVTDTGRTAANYVSARVVDYDGSGRQSILWPGNDHWYVFQPYYDSSARQYTLSGLIDTGITLSSLPEPETSDDVAVIGDLDGDGYWDIVGLSSTDHFILGMHKANPVLVDSVTDGTGNYVQFQYQQMTVKGGSSIYSAGTTPSYPRSVAFNGPLMLVSSYTASSGANNGDPSNYTNTFTYQGAARDLDGRGFLGFDTVQEIDGRTGHKLVTEYDQSFPYIGLVDEQTISNGSGALLSDTTNSFCYKVTAGSQSDACSSIGSTPGPWMVFPYVKVSTVMTYGSGNDDAMSGQLVKTLKTTSTVDIYGNTTLVKTDVNPGASDFFETNVITSYAADNGATSPVTNWCLKLPDDVTVAKAFGSARTFPGTASGSNTSQAREVTYSNDFANCRVNSQTAVANEPGMSLATTYKYESPAGVADPDGNVDEVIVADGNGLVLRDTVYSYGGASGVFASSITRKDPYSGIDLQTDQAWDLAKGVMLSQTDVNNTLTTSYSYDEFGRKTMQVEPDGTYTTWGYSFAGTGCPAPYGGYLEADNYVDEKHFSSGDTAGASLRTCYDSFGRALLTRKFVLDGQAAYTSTQYGIRGLVVASTTPYTNTDVHWTKTIYDDQNRPQVINRDMLIAVGGPDFSQSTFQYNQAASGAVAPYAVTQTVLVSGSASSPTSESTTRYYSSAGYLSQVDDAKNSTVYAYDPFGGNIHITDQAGHVTTVDYDSLGHKISLTDPDLGHWSYKYDALGELVCQTDAIGQAIVQGYDNLGRLRTRLEVTGGGDCTSTTGNTSNWDYDVGTKAAGRLASETNNNGFTKTYGYDTYGRLSTTDTLIGADDYQIITTYDSFGRVASTTYPAMPSAPPDTAPVANAGSYLPTPVGSPITLDGSASSDSVDHGPLPLGYLWSQLTGPTNVGIDGARTPTVGFTPDTAGSYSFQLMVGDGQLTNTSTASVTVLPGKPGTPQFSPSGINTDGNYTVSWADAAGHDTATYVYHLYESTDGGSTYTQVPGNFSGTSAPLTGRGSGAGPVTYTYRVEACLGSLCSAYSNTASIQVKLLPTAPAGPVTDDGDSDHDGDYVVSWNTISIPGIAKNAIVYNLEEATGNSGGPTSSYTVRWSGTFSNATTVGTHTMSHPGNGAYYYYYKVYATDANGDGPESSVDTIHLVVRPGVPGAFSPASQSNVSGNFTIAWGAASGKLTSYQLYRDLSSSFTDSTYVYEGAATSSYQTVPTLGTWYFRVRACNSSDGTKVCSGWRSYATATYNAPGQGGCGLPPPQQCQLVLPDGDLAFIGSGVDMDLLAADPEVEPLPMLVGQELAIAGTSERVIEPQLSIQAGAVASAQARLAGLRHELMGRAPSLIRPAEQPAWRKNWRPTYESAALTDIQVDRNPVPETAEEALELAEEAGVYRADVDDTRSLSARLAAPAPGSMGTDGYGIQQVTGTTTNLVVNYVYDARENLEAVVNAQDPTLIYWQAQSMDAQGHYTGEFYGNNVLTTAVYDPYLGVVLGVQSGVGASTNLQNLQYDWDGYGNLEKRQDLTLGLTESFQYDELNRMTSASVTGGAGGISPLTLTYNAMGDIKTKSGVGTYVYDPAHAHLVQSVTGTSGTVNYQFDPNGNMLSSSDGRTATWTPENQPSQITASGNCMTFAYDPDGMRYSEQAMTGGCGGSGTTTLEIGGQFEAITAGGSTSYRLMIAVGAKTVAVMNVQSSGAFTLNYLHYDNLGSVDTITDAFGSVVTNGKMSFDPFGMRRNAATWAPLAAGTNYSAVTDRGYTSQQQLDLLGPIQGLGLVHMNGRVYDPTLGRFISADPKVQDPFNSQSLNRFAYVYDNPLNSTDPTGFDGESNGSSLSNINFWQLPASMQTSSVYGLLSGVASLTNAGSFSFNSAFTLPSGSNPTGQDFSTTVAGSPQNDNGLIIADTTITATTDLYLMGTVIPRTDLMYYLTAIGMTEPSPYGRNFDINDMRAAEYLPIHRAENFALERGWSWDPVYNITAAHQFAGINNNQDPNWFQYRNLDQLQKANYKKLQVAKTVAAGVLNGTELDPCPACVFMWSKSFKLPSFLQKGINEGYFFERDFGGNRYFGYQTPKFIDKIPSIGITPLPFVGTQP